MKYVALRADERIDDLIHGGRRLIQSTTAPRFAIDAVLLADFCMLRAGERVLDMGTGTAVLPLLLSVKQPDCCFVGLELMSQMADMARRSVDLNSLGERIEIVEGDIVAAAQLFGRASFDVVLSNPPYFKAGSGRLNDNALYAAARSELYCPLAVLLDSAVQILKPGGRLFLVHRAVRTAELIGQLEQRQLHVQRLRMVQPFADRPANLLLLEARKGGRGDTLVLPPLLVYAQQGCYSREMERIYGGRTLSGGDTDW